MQGYTKARKNYKKRNMVYARKNGKRKGVSKKETYAIAKKVVHQQLEKKYLDNQDQFGAGNIDNDGTVYSLSNILLGTGESSRIGDEVTPTSLRVRYNITSSGFKQYFNIDTVDPSLGLFYTAILFRVLIFQWKGIGEALNPVLQTRTPKLSDVLTTAGGTSNVHTFYNKEYGSQYVILHDKTYVISNSDKVEHFVDLTFNLKTIKFLEPHINYNDTPADDLQTGGYYILMISDQGVGSLYPAEITFYSRLNYIDG